MADYKDIVGTTVRNNDGVFTSAKTGELFYDETNRNFSYRFPNVTAAGSWRTGGNLNTARQSLGNTGTQTSSLSIGGDQNGTPTAQTESWDGSSWTEVGDLNTARNSLAGSGVSNTSALAFGGGRAAINESWNGTAWTELNDLNTGRGQLAGAGTQTAALAFGGENSGGANFSSSRRR